MTEKQKMFARLSKMTIRECIAIRFPIIKKTLFSKCKECHDGEIYPIYGIAPHIHDLSGGSFIGSTRIKDKSEWEDNFVEDKEVLGCGIYYCPNPQCKNHKDNYKK